MYSIYASFRHPDTGREVASYELDICNDSTVAENLVETYTKIVDANTNSRVNYIRGYIHTDTRKIPLVVVMKKLI